MEEQKEEPKDDIGLNPIFAKRAALMMEATMTNKTELVKTYIQRGYPIKIIDRYSQSPLGTAAFQGNVAMVSALLEAYQEEPEQKSDPNCFYFRKYTHDFVLTSRYLTKFVKTTNTDFGYAPLHWACGNLNLKYRENDVLQVVQLLLEHGANPSYIVSDLTGVFNRTSPIEPEKAIDLAYFQRFFRVAEVLKQAEKTKFKLEEQKKESEFQGKSLEDFFENGDKEGQEKEKSTIDDIQLKKLAKELFVAARIGNVLRVKNLLKKDVPATYVDKFSFLTAISAAANTGSYKVVKVLLKNQVDPNYQYIPEGNTIGGPTALHALCRNNNIDEIRRIKIASILLTHGARTDLPAIDPRIILRSDRQSPHYNHPADLVENHQGLIELLKRNHNH